MIREQRVVECRLVKGVPRRRAIYFVPEAAQLLSPGPMSNMKSCLKERFWAFARVKADLPSSRIFGFTIQRK